MQKKYRVAPLGNIKTGETQAAWIVQCKIKHRYMNCLNQDGPMIYDTKAEALAHIPNTTDTEKS